MAGEPVRLNMTSFRTLVVLAIGFHAVGLFVLPRLDFLFSPETMELMKYGGHGAKVNVDHPLVFALYLLPYPALIGLFFAQMWGRYVLLAFVGLVTVGSFFFGAAVSGPPETSVSLIASLLDGAILGLAFFSPLGKKMQPSNHLMQPTDQQRSAADQER
jgi:hypothetical protein